MRDLALSAALLSAFVALAGCNSDSSRPNLTTPLSTFNQPSTELAVAVTLQAPLWFAERAWDTLQEAARHAWLDCQPALQADPAQGPLQAVSGSALPCRLEEDSGVIRKESWNLQGRPEQDRLELQLRRNHLSREQADTFSWVEWLAGEAELALAAPAAAAAPLQVQGATLTDLHWERHLNPDGDAFGNARHRLVVRGQGTTHVWSGEQRLEGLMQMDVLDQRAETLSAGARFRQHTIVPIRRDRDGCPTGGEFWLEGRGDSRVDVRIDGPDQIHLSIDRLRDLHWTCTDLQDTLDRYLARTAPPA